MLNRATVFDAVNLIAIAELPDDLFDLIRAWQYNPDGDYSEASVLAFIRHRYSNYDDLRRSFGLDNWELDVLRDVVNARARATLQQWQVRRGR